MSKFWVVSNTVIHSRKLQRDSLLNVLITERSSNPVSRAGCWLTWGRASLPKQVVASARCAPNDRDVPGRIHLHKAGEKIQVMKSRHEKEDTERLRPKYDVPRGFSSEWVRDPEHPATLYFCVAGRASVPQDVGP